jgi:hypothetical protein
MKWCLHLMEHGTISLDPRCCIMEVSKVFPCLLHDSRGFEGLGVNEGKHIIRFRYMHKHAGTNRKPLRVPV